MENTNYIGNLLPLFSEQQDQLYDALAKAQGQMDTALKTAYNPKFNSRYADWETVKEVSREPLSKNRLCVTQPVIQLFTDYKILYTRLGHASGQFIASTWHLDAKAITRKDGTIPELNDHDIARCHTYNKRYAYASIIGLSIGEDDDGNTSWVKNEQGHNTAKDNKRNNGNVPPKQESFVPIEKIAEVEVLSIVSLIDSFGPDRDIVSSILLKSLKVSHIADIPRTQYDYTVAYLTTQLEKYNKKKMDNNSPTL